MRTELDYRWELKQERLEGREEGREEGLEEGLERGREEGREEGVIMKAQETARKMKERGLDFNIIADCTGLSTEAVLAL